MSSEVARIVAMPVEAAAAAGRAWRATPAADRAIVLEAVADALLKHADELWPVADEETHLGEARLRGEVARTASQFRLFADVLRDGGWVDAIIDHADPTATPPRPDVRRMLRPLGVVAVFSASNFPFAFSVAGGDTVSALAAGCPVVVKAHEGHPRTSDATAAVVRQALPDPALLGLVHGFESGAPLVQHPLVTAVGFTGSLAGGTAIQGLIAKRPDPIPFFGELGSVNPVVVLPSADPAAVATGFAGSLTLGVGQFCTNPGLVFVPEEGGYAEAIALAVAETTGGVMLTDKIHEGYLRGLVRLDGLERLAVGQAGPSQGAEAARVFTIGLAAFVDGLPGLAEECFGPAAIVVKYLDKEDLPDVLRRLPGSLTASIHASSPDDTAGTSGDIVEAVTGLAGRVIWNGWPTGVAVSWAMHHGGPWPATTNAQHTSVGATSIRRWLTPVAYQDWPDALLPPELQDANPLGIPRRIAG
ncbi:aldehyde dehydrogenase (NADP(+)) [Streptosporangiaceae bacterium NEAU-GS5]|nr:aldehyde dehydrogenase (NADP(+)) [Streptosporangiaceae bacterium NEAU-GS5]